MLIVTFVNWQLDSASPTGFRFGFVGNNTAPSWRVVAAGDFDGNGTSDLVFQNSLDGQVCEWQLNGTTITGFGFVGANTDPSWHGNNADPSWHVIA